MIAVGKALGKSIQRSKSVVGKTGRIVGRTTLGVATLDKRMIKESVSMIGDVVNSNNSNNNNTRASSNKKKGTSSSNIVRHNERQIIRQKSTYSKLTRNLQAMNLDGMGYAYRIFFDLLEAVHGMTLTVISRTSSLSCLLLFFNSVLSTYRF